MKVQTTEYIYIFPQSIMYRENVSKADNSVWLLYVHDWLYLVYGINTFSNLWKTNKIQILFVRLVCENK